MPYSDGQGKDVALDWYRMISPITVIDVGAGSGTYAKLMRAPADAIEVEDTRWTAIEAWAPYAEGFGLFHLYDQVVAADVRALGWPTFQADLVIFGDVLEHMTTTEARAVLAEAKRAATNIIVSIPVLHLDQDAVNGNPFERHIDHWTYDAMRNELGDSLIKTWCGDVLAYYWWRRP